MDSYMKAAQNRSIRTIRTELDFLADSSLLSQAQVSSILALLPESASGPTHNRTAAPTSPPVSQVNSLSLNEKQQNTYSPPPGAAVQPPPPPAYSQPTHIAVASALYAYTPTDAGDLALAPQDRVLISEYMNADWARGRNERTGQEGIFPRSYVNIVEDKPAGAGPPMLPVRGQQQQQPAAYSSGYGNVPVEVANAPQDQQQGGNKFNEQGKKFGKKLGNAAIFGAGASIGSNIVNGIF